MALESSRFEYKEEIVVPKKLETYSFFPKSVISIPFNNLEQTISLFVPVFSAVKSKPVFFCHEMHFFKTEKKNSKPRQFV